jgi:hypothetical protein
VPILYEDLKFRKKALNDNVNITVNPTTTTPSPTQAGFPWWIAGVAAAGTVAIVIGVALASKKM